MSVKKLMLQNYNLLHLKLNCLCPVLSKTIPQKPFVLLLYIDKIHTSFQQTKEQQHLSQYFILNNLHF